MAGEKKQITRNRASYSCQTCRRRKVRCDKQHPKCGACTKLEEVCVYGDPDKNELPQVVGSTDTSRKRRATGNDTSDQNDNRSPSSAFGAIEQNLKQLTSLVKDLNHMAPNSIETSPDIERLDALSLSQHTSRNGDDAFQESVSAAADHEDSQHDRAGHVDSWNKVLSKLEQLNVLLKAGIRAQIVSHNHTRPSSVDPLQRPLSGLVDSSYLSLSNIQPNRDLPVVPEGFDPRIWRTGMENDMLAPSEDESAALFRSWLWAIYPVVPIMPPVLAWEKYHSFHHWYRHGLDRGKPNPDPGFMPMIVFIWYTGYASLSVKGKKRWFPATTDVSTWMRALRVRLENHIQTMRTERQVSVYSLIAAVSFHTLALGGQDIMENHVCNIFNIRAAQGLGLHNERTLRDLNVDEAEMRRRLWWETLSIDTSISTVSGMPVVLDERYTDTRMPSELKESCIGTQDADEYEAHLKEPDASPDRPDDPANWQTTSLVSVHHLVASARHILTVATKNVLKANMSANAMTMHELKEIRQSMHKVGEEIRSIINRIQTRGVPELDFVPPTSPPAEVDHLDEMGETVTIDEIGYFLREETTIKGTSPIMKHHRTMTIAFHKWSRIMLSMSLDRLDCISYAPFLKNSKSRLWAVARNCALRSCHAYMRKFLCLAEDPELRMFRWAWTSLFHPMHATIIMLIDNHDRPHSDEASRSRALIDKLFSLISPFKIMEFSQFASTDILPLKEGGEEAWTMLRKLRHKAWQNAGLDPDVLWTEEDQTLVGVGKPLRENDLFIRSLREDIISQHRRIKKQGDGRTPSDQRIDFNSSEYQSAKHQRLHPSEVTQGDRVSGPVVREVADLESMTILPPILLLRARSDQELMPYPVTDRHSSHVAGHRPEQHDTPKDNPDQHNDEAEVLHIGELIRKIQRTRRANQADKATPVPQMYTTLSSQLLPTANLSKDTPTRDFRSLRSAEHAAYQDIFDTNTTQPMELNINNESLGYQTMNELFTANSRFSSTPNQYTTVGQTQSITQRPAVSNIQTLPYSTTCEPLPSTSSIAPPPLNHSFTEPMPQATVRVSNYRSEHNMQSSPRPDQHQTFSPIPQMPMSTGQVPLTINTPANDAANTSTAMDVDFDWNRWDEMFGQFADFAEMLTSNEGDGVDGNEYHFGAGSH